MTNLHWQHVVTSRNTFFFLNIEQSPNYFRYEPLYQVGKKIGQKPLLWRYMVYTFLKNTQNVFWSGDRDWCLFHRLG